MPAAPPQTRGVALVTGAGSGFGLLTSLELARAGFHVFGGVRTLSRGGELLARATAEDLHVESVDLDLGSPPSIGQAVATAAAAGPIEVLVNNAGTCLLGAFEHLTTDELHRQFTTNVFGAVALTQAVLPHMRARRRGRVISISSGTVFGPMPMLSAYAASKAAFDAMTGALRLEVAGLGIGVTTIHPGVFRTGFLGRSDWTAAAQTVASPYAAGFDAMQRQNRASVESSRADPAAVARAVRRAALAARPPVRVVVGRDAAMTRLLGWLLPERWFGGIIRRYLGV